MILALKLVRAKIKIRAKITILAPEKCQELKFRGHGHVNRSLKGVLAPGPPAGSYGSREYLWGGRTPWRGLIERTATVYGLVVSEPCPHYDVF